MDYRLRRGPSLGVSPTDYEVALVGLADVFSFEGGALELDLGSDLGFEVHKVAELKGGFGPAGLI